MLVKECRAFVKAVGDATAGGDPEGTFEAIVSVFGNKDSVGDVVMPDAFDEDLAQWKASGDPIPVIWSHDWSDPFSHIGATVDARALLAGDPLLPDDIKALGGLYIKGLLDIADNEKAAQVYKLMAARRVKQFSFAYDIVEGAWVESQDDYHYELRKMKIFETGPTLVGANQETELLGVKTRALLHGVKEGRVLAQKHVDALKEAHTTLGNVITAAEKAEDDAKSSAPKGTDSASGQDATATQNAGQPDDSPANDDGSQAASSAEQEKSDAPAQAAARLQLQIALTEGIEL